MEHFSVFTEPQSLGGLGEFSKAMQTLDYSRLHNCLEFSQPSSCLDDYVNTEKCSVA